MKLTILKILTVITYTYGAYLLFLIKIIRNNEEEFHYFIGSFIVAVVFGNIVGFLVTKINMAFFPVDINEVNDLIKSNENINNNLEIQEINNTELSEEEKIEAHQRKLKLKLAIIFTICYLLAQI